MRRLNPLKAYLLMHIFCSIFLVVFIVLITVLLVIPGVYPGNDTVNMLILSIFLLMMTSGASLSLKAFIDQRNFLERLRLENTYTLGLDTAFYNLEAFKNRVTKLQRKRRAKKKKQFVIVFTPTSLDVSSNRIRNPELNTLNIEIARFITQLFEVEQNEFNQKDNVYAFNRGAFLIYMFTDSVDAVHRFINQMQNKIFGTVTELGLKIWCQPFYGIKEVSEKTVITAAVEDAMIARNASESTYESFTFFRAELVKEGTTGLEEIALALKNDEFIPFFQPKYSLKEKRFISSEVLARWNSPKLGLVGPNRFIAKAEQAGLLSAIDIFIFKKAVKLIGESLRRGRRVLPISVNFSLYEFFSRNFLDMVVETLKENQVPASLIEIEITETTSQSNKFLSLSVIKKLKEMGIRVLMDDFGIGYSQINTLQEIPFDAIKIDKSFTDHVVDDEKTRSVVKFLVELGHINDMEVIIEGAETREQIDLLRRMHVDTVQGFYYSKAISFSEYNDLLRHNEFEKEEKQR